MDDEKYEIKEIEGYDGRYMVDTEGNVWSMYRFANRWKKKIVKTKMLFPVINPREYKIVTLFDNQGKSSKKQVHRLVALTFLDNPFNKRCVCHKDNNPSNCKLSNLYWGTESENLTQAYEDRLHKDAVPIAKMSKEGKILDVYKNQSEAGRLNHIPSQCINEFLNKTKRKSVGGFLWKRISWAEYDYYKSIAGGIEK